MDDQNQDMNKSVGVPLSEIVGIPLMAVSDSQKKLAQSAYEFMTEIEYDSESTEDRNYSRCPCL